ncbi:MAG: Atxe2 family lasso peptide isopeptidase [Novosphingobium sp.]
MLPAETPSPVAISSRGTQDCASVVPGPAKTRGAHDATADDLLSLRDFGASGLFTGNKPGFAVSPDAAKLAIQVRQAQPASNRYCQALLIFDLARPTTRPVSVAMGDDLSRIESVMYGMQGFPSGNPKPLTPAWSPDGKWIAFVQRQDGHDALFVVSSRGGNAIPASHVYANVKEFAWSASGRHLDFETDEALVAARAVFALQGRDGYRYDERFWMLAEPTPYPRETFEGGHYRVAVMDDEQRGVPQVAASGMAADASRAASEEDRAWIGAPDAPGGNGGEQVFVRVGGQTQACNYDACRGASAAWFSASRSEVLFARREGHALSRTAIWRWRPQHGEPMRILQTDDVLTGCQIVRASLFCGRERPAYPRDVVVLDPGGERLHGLVDMNPEWQAITPPQIERLYWQNRFGIPAIGDLVTPTDADPFKPLPLVVVQYETRGFLRGGTGDEYPIRAMVSAGFAVLSVSRPLDYDLWLAQQGRPVNRERIMRDWTDRASVHDSVMTGLRLAMKRAAIDNGHLAITGLSDGAAGAAYALIHSRVFSLALLSTCCEDPAFTTTGIGPAYHAMLREHAYPLPWHADRRSWRRISLAMNAAKICARIQVNAADREARMALSTLAALRDAGVSAEMYIYPDEYHIKWQPAHRASIYRRNLAALEAWRGDAPPPCRSGPGDGIG